MVFVVSLLVMTLIGATASLFLKKASNSSGLIVLIKNINLYIGICLYGTAALLNVWILRYWDYSVVLPLTSLTYVWTMVLSYIILKEKISKRKIVGVILVLIGAVLDSL